VTNDHAVISDADRADAELIWEYHRMHHQPRPCSAAIGLGSHDLGVATFTAGLYRTGLFPVIVFTGANSPTTASRFPRGEAVHFTEHAIQLGVPESAIITEPHATNTGQNIAYSRRALQQAGVHADSILLICKPYMERRAFATARKVWPDVAVVCASEPLTFKEYLTSLGDEKLVIDMLVGDLQRIIEYPALGFAVSQHVPRAVRTSYERLLKDGFDTRLLRR
jgi:uncharacterized SAM-binding protein YcdF (DUF218 family)